LEQARARARARVSWEVTMAGLSWKVRATARAFVWGSEWWGVRWAVPMEPMTALGWARGTVAKWWARPMAQHLESQSWASLWGRASAWE